MYTETRTWQRAAAACSSLMLVQGRLRFGVLRENRRQEAASHGSTIFGFGVDLAPLEAHFNRDLKGLTLPGPRPVLATPFPRTESPA